MHDGSESLLMVGVSRATTALQVVERASLDQRAAHALISSLRETHAFEGAIVLSTCNRTELYAIPAGRATYTADELRDLLAAHTNLSRRELGELAGVLYGRAAVEHFLAVVSGLDSVVLGEPEIVGQARAAISLSRDAEMLDDVMAGLANHALAAGRRVRDRTSIARGAVSVPSVAVDMAQRLLDELSSRRALVVGAGKVARAVAYHLSSRGVGSVVIANRSAEPARAIAQDVGGDAIDLDAVSEELTRSDLVVCATGSPLPLVSRRMLKAATENRERSLVVLDLAVPRNVDPTARRLTSVVLRDLDEVHRIAAQNLDDRRRALPHAWSIVRSETERFYAWRASLDAEPLIAEIYRRAEKIRALELKQAVAESSDVDEADIARLDAVTRSLVNKLLHEAASRIRTSATAHRSGRAQMGAVRELLVLRDRLPRTERSLHLRLSAVEPVADGAKADAPGDAAPRRRPSLPAA